MKKKMPDKLKKEEGTMKKNKLLSKGKLKMSELQRELKISRLQKEPKILGYSED